MIWMTILTKTSTMVSSSSGWPILSLVSLELINRVLYLMEHFYGNFWNISCCCHFNQILSCLFSKAMVALYVWIVIIQIFVFFSPLYFISFIPATLHCFLRDFIYHDLIIILIFNVCLTHKNSSGTFLTALWVITKPMRISSVFFLW